MERLLGVAVERSWFGRRVVVKDCELYGCVRTVLVGLALETGCRPVEIINIRLGEIDMRKGEARITVKTAKREDCRQDSKPPSSVRGLEEEIELAPGEEGEQAISRY